MGSNWKKTAFGCAVGAFLLAASFSGTAGADESASQKITNRAASKVEVSTPFDVIGLGRDLHVKASVSATGHDRAPSSGVVQFRVDGVAEGDPVPVTDGQAKASIPNLESGDHRVTARFRGGAGLRPSTDRLTGTVDSPAPSPAGILPCATRQVVLTAAYRTGDWIFFEGVARYSLRGQSVRIMVEGEKQALTSTTVETDGTFWAVARNVEEDRVDGTTEFRAIARGHRSWPRRLAQAISIRNRTTPASDRSDDTPLLRARVLRGAPVPVIVARQTGCHKTEGEMITRVLSTEDGNLGVGLPRPKQGEPYAIYRLISNDGTKISSPIVVRPQL